eukprot:comp19458_c0_seq1/m.22629 comp19458_c0_seq1/g.22629  ORF comp19458_c0_seq1/g.22629 comp19458_c0_seq1/m.22629 type:complete len:484 (-) comp19458_c0_seq1:443-1894(-)
MFVERLQQGITLPLAATLYVVCATFLFTQRRTKNGWPVVGWAKPLLGCALEYGKDPVKVLMDAYRAYGQQFILRLGGTDFYVITHKDDLKLFFNGKTDEMSLYLGLDMYNGRVFFSLEDDLLASEEDGTMIKILRKHVIPTYNPRTPDLDAEVRVTMGDLLNECRKNGGETVVSMHKFLMETVVKTSSIFTVGVAAGYDQQILDNLCILDKASIDFMGKGGMFASKEVAAAEQAKKIVLERLKVIHEQERAKGNANGTLSSLMMEEGAPDKAARAHDEAYNILMATVVNTLGALMILLVQVYSRPHLVKNLRKEISAVLGEKGLEQNITREQLLKMHTVRNTVKEVLRLYASALQARFTTSDIILPSSGLRVPKGAVLAASPTIIHRVADVYPDPETFDPDRWLTAMPHPMESLTFGRGFHMCAGVQLAEAEMALVLLRLVSMFEISLAPPYTWADALEMNHATLGLSRPVGGFEMQLVCKAI